MKFPRILIVPKKSKFQWDMDRLGLSASRLMARYGRQGVNASRIFASHQRQMRALQKVAKLFPDARVVSQEKISEKLAQGADLVIALGGDNHFQHVSHFVRTGVIAGINSDIKLSEGSLTVFTPETFVSVAARFKKGRRKEECWTRLKVAVDGRVVKPLALSEIFLGEASRCQMSRHIILAPGMREMQKCSGLLVATGSGSSGWYDAAGRYLFLRGNRFSRTKAGFRFIASEPFHGRLSRPKHLKGNLLNKQKLRVRSLNDSQGVILIDTQIKIPFPEGSDAVISVGEPLRVLSK